MGKIYIEENILKKLLKNVYFINGTAYAGKSTIIKMLAKKYNGIACEENYHNKLMHLVDVKNQPNLKYFETMSGWQEFINRTPEEYEKWFQGVSKEASDLEIIELIRLSESGKRIFVDTNIPLETLHKISSYSRVAIMVSPQSLSVEKFFDRNDPEKLFLLSKIKEAENPEKTMKNFKACIAKINSKEHYDEFLNSGFFVFKRNNTKTLDDTLKIIENHFGLSLTKYKGEDNGKNILG